MINYLETKNMQNISPAHFTEKFINQTNRSVFLTGKAGTGKTTLLKKIIDSTHKNTVVVAPTGIAALNAGGVTIHSLFQLPFGAFLPINGEPPNVSAYSKFQTRDTLFRGTRINKRKLELIRNIELLIIDEVSMLRSDLLDAINVKLQKIRRSNLPFGGVQVLFIGDLLQLPPVVKDHEWSVLSKYYQGQFFFHAQVLKQNPPLYIELDKIYRQSDEKFVSILNNLRNNTVTDEDLSTLNKSVNPSFDALKNDGYITLTTHNHKADKINQKALESLDSKSHFYEAEIGGEFPENIFPLPEKMELKVGAQVMFIKNDVSPEKRYYNGKIGRIITLDYDEVEVLFPEENKVISVEKYEWENVRYKLDETSGEVKEKVIGTFVQYPLKLAWAITVHKSQGLTFEKAVLDINQAFAPGQAYVALSRLTGLDGLVMQKPLQINRMQTSQDVIEYANQKKESKELMSALELQTLEYLRTKLKKAFNWDALASSWLTAEHTHKQASARTIKGEHYKWFSAQTQKLTDTLEPSRKFRAQLDKLCRPHSFDPDKLLERVEAAHDYFNKILEPILRSNIKTMLLLGRKKAVKQYLEELMELDQDLTDVILKTKRARNLIHAFTNEKPLTKENIITDTIKNYKQVKVEIVKNELKSENSSIFDQGKEADIASKLTKSKKPKKNKSKKKPTHLITLEAFNRTNSISETAKERNLAESTIYGHLGKLIREEKIDVDEVLDDSTFEDLKSIFGKEMPQSLTDAREVCKNKYSYEILRLYKSSLLL